MRTTVDLDDDILAAVRSLSRVQGRSMGLVISDLVRRGLAPVDRIDRGPGGFPTFEPPSDSAPLTVEAVRAALEDEL